MVFVFLFLTLSHYWAYTQKVKVKVAQSCLALWYPMDYIHGILQARILE